MLSGCTYFEYGHLDFCLDLALHCLHLLPIPRPLAPTLNDLENYGQSLLRFVEVGDWVNINFQMPNTPWVFSKFRSPKVTESARLEEALRDLSVQPPHFYNGNLAKVTELVIGSTGMRALVK